MKVYQKTIFDRYSCIKSFCRFKTLEKKYAFESSIFVLPMIGIMARKSMKNSFFFCFFF